MLRTVLSTPRKYATALFRKLRPGCGVLTDHYAPRELVSNWSSLELITHLAPEQVPKISIVIPSYNQGAYIEATINSIIDQEYPNIQILVADGGSTDNTIKVIDRYRKYIYWWVSEKDDGQSNAINKGMRLATGDILSWLNSDDCLMPGTLHRVAKEFTQRKDTDVVYGHRVLINRSGRDVGKWILPGHDRFILTYADYIPQETMFWTSRIWNKIGGSIDESFKFAMDWDLICKFSDSRARIRLLPFFMGQFRVHSEQKTSAMIEETGFAEMERIRDRYYIEYASNHVPKWFLYRLQRAALYSYLFRARIKELLWQLGLTKIR